MTVIDCATYRTWFRPLTYVMCEFQHLFYKEKMMSISICLIFIASYNSNLNNIKSMILCNIILKLKSHFRSCIGRSPNCINGARIFGKKTFFCITGSLSLQFRVQRHFELETWFRYFSKSVRQCSCALVSTDLALRPLTIMTAWQWSTSWCKPHSLSIPA